MRLYRCSRTQISACAHTRSKSTLTRTHSRIGVINDLISRLNPNSPLLPPSTCHPNFAPEEGQSYSRRLLFVYSRSLLAAHALHQPTFAPEDHIYLIAVNDQPFDQTKLNQDSTGDQWRHQATHQPTNQGVR